MDQRLSDTPGDEAARPQEESVEQAPKQARTRKSASPGTSRASKPSARKRTGGATEGASAKPVAKKRRATSSKRQKNVDEGPLAGLAAQGFSEGEAARLLEVSARAAYSTEARESEAVMNRLRFTRWLIERGLINEFTV